MKSNQTIATWENAGAGDTIGRPKQNIKAEAAPAQTGGHSPLIKDKQIAITRRLEYLRRELRTERISQGELLELASLAEHIAPGDVELLEAAGVPEHEAEAAPAQAGGHTPGTNWGNSTWYSTGDVVRAVGTGVVVANVRAYLEAQAPALAAQIAKEHNSHSALLEALKAVVDCPDYRHIATHEMDQARAAISQAGGAL